MAKIVLPNQASGFDVARANSNKDKIAEALNNGVLWRDTPNGEPNQMFNDLDMNNSRVYNLPEPILEHEAARKKDLDATLQEAGNILAETKLERNGAEAAKERAIAAELAAKASEIITNTNVNLSIEILQSASSGTFKYFKTKSEAILADVPDGNFVQVFVDESEQNSNVIYKKEAGLLVKQVDLDSLRKDLSDPNEGSGLVAFKRSLSPLYGNFFSIADHFATEPLNIIWLINLVVDRPDGNDPNTWDWTPAFKYAIDTGSPVSVPNMGFKYRVQPDVLKTTEAYQVLFSTSNATIKAISGNGPVINLSTPWSGVSGIIFEGVGKTIGDGSGVLSSSGFNLIKNCAASGFSNAGLSSGSSATDFKIQNSTAIDNKSGISSYGTVGVQVSNCTATENGVSGTGGGIVLMGTGGGQSVEGFNVSGCISSGNMSTGLVLNGAQRGSIEGGSFDDNGTYPGSASGVSILWETASQVADIAVVGVSSHRNTDHGLVAQVNRNNSSWIRGLAVSGGSFGRNSRCGLRLVEGIEGAVLSGFTAVGNGTDTTAPGYRHGVMLASRVNRSVITGFSSHDNAEDGCRITDMSVDFVDTGSGENLVSNGNCRGNGGYGVNLHRRTVPSTANNIVNMVSRFNSSGQINDQHTNTNKSGNRITFDRISGTASFTGGFATISTTEVTSDDIVLLSIVSSSGGSGAMHVESINPGVSFSVRSTNPSDTSTFKWQIVH